MGTEEEPLPETHAPPPSDAEGALADGMPAENAEPEARPKPWFGRIIDDRYRIVELLGEGGMGTVFIAEHRQLRKTVALKVINPTFLDNEEVAARFAREAMASAQLEHPHVASALDYGSLPEGGAYLVLELVRGPSLRSQIESQGPARWKQVCEIGAQIADALCAAHAMGIVHRDLKPENVLLEVRHGGPPIAKVLDFGIARVQRGDAPEAAQPGRALTRVGAVMGTPGYMAPEQAAGDVVDERADLYALGVILWEMLAGRSLFDAPNLTGILSQQFATNLTQRLAEESVSTPRELAQLIGQLLAPIPSDRPASAADVREILRTLSAGDVALNTGLYRIAIPEVMRGPTSRLQAACQAALGGLSPHLRRLMSARGVEALRRYGRIFWQRLRRLSADAALYPRAWARGARQWLHGAPRAVRWAGTGAAAIIVASLATAVVLVSPDTQGKSLAQGAGHAGESTAASELDPEVQSHVDALSESSTRKARRAAARWLQSPPPATEPPAYAQALARLELGPDCQARKAALRRLRSLGDRRALPAIARWNDKPTTGCGLRKNHDCYVCIRGDVQATYRALRQRDDRTASR